MRKFAAVCLAVAMMACAVAAADRDPPLAGPGAVRAVFPPIQLFTWSGPYIGANIGGAWGDSDTNGFLAGVQGGFNVRMRSVVLGVEADWTWGGVDGSDTSLVGLSAAVPGTLRAESGGMATLTGRLGYAWERSLYYVKGGAAWSRASYTATVATAPASTFSADETRSGWTIGFGYEHAFRNAWSGRLEYMLMDFGDDQVALRAPTGNLLIADIDSQIHVIKLGINYRFTWLSAPFGSGY